MKKMLLMLTATLMMSGAAMAQNEQGEKKEIKKFDKTEMIQNMTDRMVKKYGLNEKQSKKLLALNTEYSDKMGPMGMEPRHGGPRPGMGPRPDQEGPQMAPPCEEQGGKQSCCQKRGCVKDSLNAPAQENMTNAEKRPSKEEMEAKRNEIKANREAYNEELKKIMTDEQYSQYTADQKKSQDGNKRGKRRGPGPRPQNDSQPTE